MIFDGKNLKKTYLHYLFAGIGSAVIVSIYSIVDAIMVGQYEGYNGTAALSVVMPIWTIILSLGLLFRRWRRLADVQGAGRRETSGAVENFLPARSSAFPSSRLPYGLC